MNFHAIILISFSFIKIESVQCLRFIFRRLVQLFILLICKIFVSNCLKHSLKNLNVLDFLTIRRKLFSFCHHQDIHLSASIHPIH